MKKLAIVIAAFAIAALGVFATGTAAQAYPQTTPRVHVNHQTIVEGSTLVIHGDYGPGCAWTFTFNGQTQTADGSHVTVRFKVPKVDRKTTYTAYYTCNGTPVQSFGALGESVVVPTKTFSGHITITVLPAHSSAAGHTTTGAALPNTGGPDLGLIAAGGALVLGGGAAITLGLRRRRSAA